MSDTEIKLKYAMEIEKNLSHADFFQSLLQEAHRLYLLDQSELENLQLQSLKLLAKQAERYARGDSSIKVEQAQDIMHSIFYTIGHRLKYCSDINMGITALKQKPLSELYSQGKKLIEAEVAKAKELLHTIQNDGFTTDNEAYNYTVHEGIPLFFSTYNVDFAVHDTPGSIDYPLCIDKMDLTGIEYIHSYLQKLYLENQFCTNFSKDDIDCLLQGYDKQHQSLLINIFGLVLANAVGCISAELDFSNLSIEPVHRQYLQKKLEGLSAAELENLVQNTSYQIFNYMSISGGLLQEYIATALTDLVPRLKMALENNRLESLFISSKRPPVQPPFRFEDGAKMDDEVFRAVVEELRNCRYVSDKVAIIKRELHSIADLADLLGSCCIFEDEFNGVFQSLGDMELALLMKYLPTDMKDWDYQLSENEKEWYKRFEGFIAKMDPVRKERIKKTSQEILL